LRIAYDLKEGVLLRGREKSGAALGVLPDHDDRPGETCAGGGVLKRGVAEPLLLERADVESGLDGRVEQDDNQFDVVDIQVRRGEAGQNGKSSGLIINGCF
jgi:hypothetical protein